MTGLNVTFKIYNGDNEPFHNLELKKATYDSVVMSLGDKISGDVYYKDNSLSCTMHEYIVYNGVQYNLVNPPTIVREGMVSDNGELKGMTKYSFEFYHPMHMLSDFPFTDVAVSNDELLYKSQDKVFSWVGYLQDYINKLNKNLQGTQWICDLSPLTQESTLRKFSDVLTFDNNTIADALKTAFDTWGVPFAIDVISVSDELYAQGKRFLIHFGEPSNEIYESEDAKEAGTPFVFKFGQGVGLKNNSATPKNNKIITRIAGYGSERNIPFGYPQIVWDENGDESELQYPLYDGIVGGRWVKLIKHPFTRSHLMPTIYAETVARKVNPMDAHYDPNTTIIDYHDAIDQSIYQHTINPNSPSYESHEFEDIFPELGVKNIVAVQPINDDMTDAPDWDDSVDDQGNYKQGYFKLTLPVLDFDLYACAAITEEMQINMRTGACIGCTFTIQVDWEDYKLNFYDADNNFSPDGSQRDLTKYPKSQNGQITVICQKDTNTFGTLMPNVFQKPKGTIAGEYDGDEFVILGISLPESHIINAQYRLDAAMDEYMLENNVYYFDYPLKFDEHFLATHTYILNQIKNNTIVRFEFKGEIIPLYVKQITIKYGESPLPQYTITLTDDVDIVLNQIGQVTDDVSKMRVQISSLQSYWNRSGAGGSGTDNTKLSKVVDDTASGVITFLQGLLAGNWVEDSSGAAIHQNNDGNWVIEADYFNVRKKLQANEVEIMHSSHIGGRLIATAGSMVVTKVQYIDNYQTTVYSNIWNGSCYKCWFNTTDSDGNVIYNTFKVGDLAYCETFNLTTSSDGLTNHSTGNHFYWRKVIETGNDYIILSNVFGEYAAESDYPYVGDHITLLGSQAYIGSAGTQPIGEGEQGVPAGVDSYEIDTSRQNAIIMAGAGAGNPYIRVYKGIDTFVLPNPVVQISPSGSWITVTDNNGNDVKITDLIDSLQDQVDQVKEQDDKQIVLWFGNETPTLNNAPAVNWETEQIRHEHANDIYYNRDAGLAYSFIETITENVASYSWDLLTDQDVLRSLELAAKAQDTADGKRRVFVARPTQAQAYDIGDLWVNATFPTEISDGESTFGDSTGTIHTIENPLYNNDILRCVVAKSEGDAFNISHWQPVQEYTTSRIVQNSNQIKLEVQQGLETTGIDITNGTIELKAGKTVFTNPNGNQIASFTDDGLQSNKVQCLDNDGNKRVEVDMNGVRMYYPLQVGQDSPQVMKEEIFIYDSSGNVIGTETRYYNLNGSIKWRLDQAGVLSTTEVKEFWSSYHGYCISEENFFTLVTAVKRQKRPTRDFSNTTNEITNCYLSKYTSTNQEGNTMQYSGCVVKGDTPVASNQDPSQVTWYTGWVMSPLSAINTENNNYMRTFLHYSSGKQGGSANVYENEYTDTVYLYFNSLGVIYNANYTAGDLPRE